MSGQIGLALGVGATAAFQPLWASIGVMGAAVFMALLQRPERMTYLLIALAFAVKPLSTPAALQFGPVTIFWFEPVLLAFTAYLLVTQTTTPAARIAAFTLSGLVMVGFALGALSGASPIQMASDGRGMVVMVLAFIAGSHAANTVHIAGGARTVLVVLWWSAILVLISALTGLPIEGRSEDASLFLLGGATVGNGATRILSSATFLSLAVLCAALILQITGGVAWRKAIPFVLPALVIVFLSFSRNSILGLAAAMVFALVMCRDLISVSGGAIKLAAASAILGAILALITLTSPGGPWIATQADAYATRVVGGLSNRVRSIDTSALYRTQESKLLIRAFTEQPLLGHGIGYAYQPARGAAGSFTATTGRYYAHNFYLWLLAKSGLLGLVAFLAVAMNATLAGMRRASKIRLALGGTGAALLAVSFVAPLPLAPSSALLIGLVLGLLAGRQDAPDPLKRMVRD
jgi:O-antigen ligase